MQVNHTPLQGNTIPAYLAGVIVQTTQVGVGILGYQRAVVERAGHDAWISVLLAGLFVHLTIWVMCRTLQRYPSADLYGIHYDVYGKWLGRGMSILFTLYMVLSATVIIRNYIEVVQAWMFPEVPTAFFAFVFLLLALYTLLGGIRVVAGYCFITVIVVIWLVVDLYFPIQYARWNYLLPVLDARWSELLSGMMTMSLTLIGFEMLYFVYPFVQNKQQVHRAAQWGALVSNLIYVLMMVVTLVFFSPGQLKKIIWATLILKKVVYMPFLERFEFIAISLWLFIIMPNVMLYIWASARGFKRMFAVRQRAATSAICLVIFLSSMFFLTRQQIQTLNEWTAQVGIVLAFIYPYILYGVVLVRQKLRNREEEQIHS